MLDTDGKIGMEYKFKPLVTTMQHKQFKMYAVVIQSKA